MLLQGRGEPLVLRIMQGDAIARHYIYVDNIGVVSTDGTLATMRLDEIADAYRALGLTIHEVEVTSNSLEALGVVLDFKRHQTRITQKRLWRTRGALEYCIQRGRASGMMIEVLVGHCTYCGLLNRGSL